MANPGTNVPSPTFGPQGFVPPLESAVLAGVQADIQAAFTVNGGPPLNFTTNNGAATNPTPQGQLSNSLTAIIGMCNDTFELFTNLVDPALSYGRMQDAIGRIYYNTRIPGVPTVVTTSVVGVVGTQILAGFTATDQSGNAYTTLAPATITLNATTGIASATVDFTAVALGPLPVPTSFSSFQAVPGVDAINVVGGVVGSNQETPQQFEARRSQSTGWLSTGPLGAILGAVLAVPGVVDAYVTDNSTGSGQTKGGVFLPSPVLFVCVSGGAAQDVAQAIWTRKIPGCPYYTGTGATTVTVFDESPQYAPPFPAYSVSFVYAVPLQFVVSVSFLQTAQLPSNAATLAQAAVVACFAGLAQTGWSSNAQPIYAPRAKIGAVILSSYIAPALQFLGSWAQLVTVTIGSTNLPDSTFQGNISNGSGLAGTILTVNSITGSIALNGTLFDASGLITPGTVVTSQISGTPGGVGTYFVSNSQLVQTETIMSVSPTLTEIAVNINQEPSVNAMNVIVTTHI